MDSELLKYSLNSEQTFNKITFQIVATSCIRTAFKTHLSALAANVKLSTHRQIKTQQTHRSLITDFHTNLIFRECYTSSRTTGHETSSFQQQAQYRSWLRFLNEPNCSLTGLHYMLYGYILGLGFFEPGFRIYLVLVIYLLYARQIIPVSMTLTCWTCTFTSVG